MYQKYSRCQIMGKITLKKFLYFSFQQCMPLHSPQFKDRWNTLKIILQPVLGISTKTVSLVTFLTLSYI